MGGYEELLPAGVHMVAEEHAVFAVAVVVEERTAHRRAAPMVQRRHIELHDRMVIDRRDLPI